MQATSWTPLCNQNTAPVWSQTDDLRGMTFRDNERKLLERLLINLELILQPVQIVAVAFDLIPVQHTVQNSDVHTHPRMRKSQLIDNKYIVSLEIWAKPLVDQHPSYSRVVNSNVLGSLLGYSCAHSHSISLLQHR